MGKSNSFLTHRLTKAYRPRSNNSRGSTPDLGKKEVQKIFGAVARSMACTWLVLREYASLALRRQVPHQNYIRSVKAVLVENQCKFKSFLVSLKRIFKISLISLVVIVTLKLIGEFYSHICYLYQLKAAVRKISPILLKGIEWPIFSWPVPTLT
jgi:hypothetical protein